MDNGIKANKPAEKSVHARQIERLRMLFGNCNERIKIKIAKAFSITTMAANILITVGNEKASSVKVMLDLFEEFMVAYRYSV